MRLRGELNRSNRSESETYGIQVIKEQAAHELKYGEPRVRFLIFIYSLCLYSTTHSRYNSQSLILSSEKGQKKPTTQINFKENIWL